MTVAGPMLGTGLLCDLVDEVFSGLRAGSWMWCLVQSLPIPVSPAGDTAELPMSLWPFGALGWRTEFPLKKQNLGEQIPMMSPFWGLELLPLSSPDQHQARKLTSDPSD